MRERPLPNWRNVDLNLLAIFHAVMLERSVTAAAVKLNMSQPAVSHALTRLRQSLGDELLVRSPEGIEPTPFALMIEPGISDALEQLRMTIEKAKGFDPVTADRQFTLGLSNYAALVMAAPLAAAIAKEAPGIKLDLRPSGTLNVFEGLERGDLDAIISQNAAPAERFSDLRLFDEDYSSLLRHDHPALSNGQISLQDLGFLQHLVLSSTGDDTDFLESKLRDAGLVRSVALKAPLLAASTILRDSDLVSIVGTRAAHTLAQSAQLGVARLPFQTPTFPVALLWHRRCDDFDAHRWLRGTITRVAKGLRH